MITSLRKMRYLPIIAAALVVALLAPLQQAKAAGPAAGGTVTSVPLG